MAIRAALKASSTHEFDLRRTLRRRPGPGAGSRGRPRGRPEDRRGPAGGASLAYWEPIRDRYGLDLTVLNRQVDPDVPVHDRGSRRRDPHGLFEPVRHGRPGHLKDKFDIAWGCDPDADRHGIVTPFAGLLNPNHYLPSRWTTC